jgi:transcription termination factor Rho
MHLKDLKKKTPADLVSMAEELGVEGASTLRKQDLLFAILKVQAENGDQIMGLGTIEVLQDGFGFLRSPEANYLAGPDDIYVSPTRCASTACARAIPSKARSARPRMASAISR